MACKSIENCRYFFFLIFRYKLLRWYLQSYFVGILRVICGFRDRDGIVSELGIYNVRDMPQIAEVSINFDRLKWAGSINSTESGRSQTVRTRVCQI